MRKHHSIREDIRGNVLLITVGGILLFMGVMGASIDFGRYALVQLRAQQACDAAALAVQAMSPTINGTPVTNAERDATVARYFAMNYPANYMGLNLVPTGTYGNGTVSVTVGNTLLPTVFLKFLGFNNFTIHSTNTVVNNATGTAATCAAGCYSTTLTSPPMTLTATLPAGSTGDQQTIEAGARSGAYAQCTAAGWQLCFAGNGQTGGSFACGAGAITSTQACTGACGTSYSPPNNLWGLGYITYPDATSATAALSNNSLISHPTLAFPSSPLPGTCTCASGTSGSCQYGYGEDGNGATAGYGWTCGNVVCLYGTKCFELGLDCQ